MKDEPYHFFCSGCDWYFCDIKSVGRCPKCNNKKYGDRPTDWDYEENEKIRKRLGLKDENN